MLKDFTPRLYQETILATAARKNTLVVLPTGLGKTGIAMLLAAQRLRQYPNSKVVFFAPTKPLCEQHLGTFTKHIDLPEDELALFTGAISPKKRKELFQKARIIFSTPQGFENDVLGSEITFHDVSLVIFDEAHRASGDYSYTFLAKQYEKTAQYPRILALTASPGSELDKINEILENLFIEEIEIRTERDSDVREYVQEIEMARVIVSLPKEYIEIRHYLDLSFRTKILELKKKNLLQGLSQPGKKDLLLLQGQLMGELSRGERDFDMMKAVSVAAEALKIYHALELIETQGVRPLKEYLNKLESEARAGKTQAAKNLFMDVNFKSALIKTDSAIEMNIEHPKLGKLREMVSGKVRDVPDAKLIVFSQFRDTASEIVSTLNGLDGISATLFVGQARKKETGLSQKEQKRIIDDFKGGRFNCLVATSVAEEGLDIPEVDSVIFYEPVPSAIRHIQRRGRTGRHERGEVTILMAKGTRDETYHWSAQRKEKKMRSHLEDLRNRIILAKERKRAEKTLADFGEEKEIKIFADHREKGSQVLKELVDLGIRLNLSQLDVGDFVLSSRCAAEYKTVPDFVDSIIDGRLLLQSKAMRQGFQRPLFIIEGEGDLFSQRKVHPNAINGMLATIAVSYGIPILRTKNPKETANLLSIIARREQEEDQSSYTPHERKPLSEKEIQEYIISAFPGIGPTLARPLLKRFGSVRGVINASVDELKDVEKIGDKKARSMKDIIEKDYD